MAVVETNPINFPVDDNINYKLSIDYGNGHSIGSSNFIDFAGQIQMGGKDAVSSNLIHDILIGKGIDLKNKSLTIFSSIVADNRDANFVSVEYFVNGERKSRSTQMTEDISYQLHTTINFI